jgi:hypothetical protein
VYPEQVAPFADLWRSKGGEVTVDVRPEGGHTSDWAPRALLLDVVDRFSTGRPLPLTEYQRARAYRGRRSRPPLRPAVRNWLGRQRNRLLRRARP